MGPNTIVSGALHLTSEEEAMLRGEYGRAVQNALSFQIEVGSFFDAQRFVPITNAHVMGDIEVMGDFGLDHLCSLSRQNAHCVVPTSSNANCMHFEDIDCLRQDEVEVRKEQQIIRCLREMKIATTDSCINYQTVYQPKLNEHVAWGDTGTVIYANSVFGARTNYEGGYASLAASLTGRTPEYGFHLDEVRRGSILVDLQTQLEDVAEWGALGKIVGHPNQNYFAVPVFEGVQAMPTSDQLKHLGASLASYGSMAMYHMAGVTPEARNVLEAFGGRQPQARITVKKQDIEEIFRSYRYVSDGRTLVVFSAPQLSLFEMQRMAALFEGRKVAPNIQAFVTTSYAVYGDANRLGYIRSLELAGVTILKGVCFYLLQRLSKIREQNGWSNLVSNSAKLVNTITAHRFNTILRRTAECVEIACTGKLA